MKANCSKMGVTPSYTLLDPFPSSSTDNNEIKRSYFKILKTEHINVNILHRLSAQIIFWSGDSWCAIVDERKWWKPYRICYSYMVSRLCGCAREFAVLQTGWNPWDSTDTCRGVLLCV